MSKSDDLIKKYLGIDPNEDKEKPVQKATGNSSKESQKTTGSLADNLISKYSNDAYIQSIATPAARVSSPIKGYTRGAGAKGWLSYTASQKRKQEEKAKAEEEKPWYEKMIGYLGTSSPDNTLPMATATIVTENYRNDTSYQEPSDNWNDEERDIFGWLYETDRKASWQYASAVNDAIVKAEKKQQKSEIREEATDGFWSGAAHTAGALLASPLGLADYLDALAQANAGIDPREDGSVSPFEYSQEVTGGISQNLNEKYGTLSEKVPIIGGKGLGDVYGLGTSIAQSSMAAMSGGGGQALITFFGTAAASGVEDARRRGASNEQAIAYGTLAGTAEAVAEMIGVDNLMKIGAASTMRELVMNVVKQGAAEGIEEGITSILNNFADQLVMGDKSNFDILVRGYTNRGWSEEEAKKQAWIDMAEDVAFDVLGGFVSGSVHAAPQTAYQTHTQNTTYSSVYGESAMELVQEGLESAEGSLSHELATKYKAKLDGGGKLTGAEINRLVKANEQQFLAEDKASIKQAAENRLIELGEIEHVSELADILTKQATKQKLTKAEKSAIRTSLYGERVSNELNADNIRSGEYSSQWAANIGTNRVNADVEYPELMEVAMQKSGAKAFTPKQSNYTPSRTNPAKQSGENQTSIDTEDTIGESGTEANAEADVSPVKVQRIASIENGNATVRLEDGTEVSAKDADLDPDEGIRIETIASIDGISSADANFILHTLRLSSNHSAQMDALGAKEAYKYGFYGFSQEHIAKHGVFANTLTESQRQAIYNTGREASQRKTEAKQATVRRSRTVEKTGKVYFEGNREALTERQSASLSVLEKVAEALGVQIHVFESAVNEEGKHTGANGWYDPKTGSIHIDLHAGVKGEATMLFTAAHELTHFIRQWSPAKFKILADFLMEEYGKKNVNMDALVREQIAKAKRNGRTISYDTAYGEVVADSMETMLADGKVMEKLAKLKAKDKTLWQKIKDYISKLAAKIRKVYDGLSPDSVEGRHVAEMVDAIEKLQDMFTEALVEAGDNYQAAEKNTTEDGGVVMSIRNVVGESGKNYGKGVYLDADKLTNIPEDQRKATVIGLFRKLGGKKVIAYDQNGIAIEISIADGSRRFKNSKGKSIPVNNHITSFLSNPIKQEALVLADELIAASRFDGQEKAVHAHSWLDNYGQNQWDVWKVFIQEKNNSVWEATLKVANTVDGEKVLYEIHPIEMVEAARKPGTSTTNDMVAQPGTVVKAESTEATDVDLDTKTLTDAGVSVNDETDSGSLFSVRDVLDDTTRGKVANALASRFNVTEKEAMEWLSAETSLASLILNPKYSSFLDYEADPNEVAIKQNSDYPQGTVDFSNICKKRREFTQVMNRILRNFPNHVFAATDLAKIRTIMGEEGMTLPCGICYVEDRRQLDTIVAQDFIDGLKLYREGSKTRPDGKPFNANQLKGLQLTDGDTYVPTIYELVSLEGRNSLKAKNPNMEAAWVRYNNARGMQAVRLLTNEAEYKRQILKYSPKTVKSKNDHGGLRIYSFSDAEMFHLIDIIQVITDSAAVGLYLQGYTKVNEYAKAVKDTGEKLNRSLIPKGALGYHIEDGKVVLDYDTVEGIDIYSEDFFDNKDNPDVGNITIGVNDVQIRAAMVSDFVDQIIPFHTGQSEEVLGEKGIAAWQNYKDSQTEKDLATGKTASHQVNIYTEVIQAAEAEGKPIQNKRQFVEKFLQVCKDNGLQPRFAQFLNVDGDGNYVYTEGYHKFLVDFKTFAQTEVGEYLPQGPVKPIFDNAYITGLLKAYVKEQQVKDAEVAKQMPKVIERITNEIVKPEEAKFSSRDYSYESLTSKPDMKVTTVGGAVPKNRADIISMAKKNATSVGRFDPYTGSVSVHVTDIGRDVVLGTVGLKHGLEGRREDNAIVTLKAGEILHNSIRINELTPKKDNADGSYVLIGAARGNNGDLYIVRSVVNTFKHELVSMDVLYAINAKKRNRLRSMRPGFQGPVTDSTISIAELLDYVNEYFPDILPEDVLKHYGYDARPDGNLGADALYSERDTESVSNRALLANAFEGLAQNEIERNKMQEYKEKLSGIEAQERKLRELNEQIKALSFARGPRDKEKLRTLRDEATKTANRINIYDKQLLRLEASKPLQNVLEREKKKAYQRAEQRGKEALEEYREKTTKRQQELMDKWQESRKRGIESREKTAMRHKIQSVVGELNQLLLTNDKKRHVPDSLKKAVADALSLVNMDNAGTVRRIAEINRLLDELYLKKAEAEKLGDQEELKVIQASIDDEISLRDRYTKMGDRLEKLHSAYEDIQKSDDPDIANAYDPVIAGSLKELAGSIGNTSLMDMTIEQLADVYDMYRMVLTRVRDANKAFLNAKNEAISSLASHVVSEIRSVGGEHQYRAAVLDFARKFGWNNLKPVFAFEHIGSATLTEAFNQVRAGEDVWARDVTEARAYYQEKSKKYGYDSWDFDKKYRFESVSGQTFELTLDQILSLYAYSKRDQAHDHLRIGGFVFDSNIETYKEKDSKSGKSILKYKVNTADAHQINPDILADIIGNLSGDQKAFVDEMQDYLSTTMGAKGNEVTMKMYGVKLFKEKFYFPLKSAKQFMFEQNEVSGEVRIKNSGFTNKVVAKANNPVILSNFMDVWAGHVNDMSMYHAFVLPLEDFNRIFNYNSQKKEGVPPVSVKGTLQSAYTPAAVNYVKQLITDLNGGARTDPTTDIISKLMGMFKKGAVFASLSVVVQQPSAVARAAALVDTKYFIGPKVDQKRHAALWDEVKKYAPVALIKEMGYFDTNMGKSTQDFILAKEYSGFQDKMKALVTDSGYRDEVLSKAPALADEIAWCAIWEAVKREMKDQHPGLDVNSEPFLMLCGGRFTEVITKTQVYDSVLSRSALMRSKDTGMKMATAFMAEPTTSINMIADALLKGKRGDRKYCRTAIGAVIASQIINSILVSFVYAARDDDEDETYVEKYVGALTGEIFDSLNPAGYIPFIKDMVSIVRGYDVERSDMAVISDLWNAIQSLKKPNVSVYRKVEGFAGSVAQLFGLPVKNIMRDVRSIYQTIDSMVNGQQTTKAGIGYAVKATTPKWLGGGEVSNQQQLYEAYLSGDAEHLARVKSRYKDESAVGAALRKALRENDPRIHEAAIAWNANDLQEYMRLAREIIAEKHFVQDDVVLAIRAEADALTPDDSSSGTSTAKGLFTAEKFAEAIANGDEATANAIRTDIIETAQKNGKTEDEAEKSFASSVKSEMKEKFLAGSITEDQAVDALVDYCGESTEDAEEYVGQWAFQQEYGFSWADRGDAYKSGQISADKLRDILVNVGGKTEEDAMWQVKIYDWQNEGFDIDSNQKSIVEDYEVFCEPAGIDKHTYFNAYLFYDAAGEEGVAYSKTIECMPYIDSLPLTSYQKTALAKCWWAESTVNRYKTW